MSGNSFGFQHLHQMIGDEIIDSSLSADGPFFGAVSSSSVILVAYQIDLRVIGAKNFFAFPSYSWFKHFMIFQTPF